MTTSHRLEDLSGIFSENFGIAEKYKLLNLFTVFQAEILAIHKCSAELLHKSLTGKMVRIYVDKQAALIAENNSH